MCHSVQLVSVDTQLLIGVEVQATLWAWDHVVRVPVPRGDIWMVNLVKKGQCKGSADLRLDRAAS